jgi:Fe-S cluster assembly protein SufD
MNLKFEEFQKSNLGLKELDNIRIKSFKKFEAQGFPTKKQEHWKYTDLKNIITDNFQNLQIFNGGKNLVYNNKLIIKSFEHNKIILLNGSFIESSFIYEDEKKITIKSLKSILENKNDFNKIKEYFDDDQNSMLSLNHALTNDGIVLDIENNYSFNKPLVVYNLFDKTAESKIINNKIFISLGDKSNLCMVDFYRCENNIKYFNNTIHNYTIKKNATLKKYNINDSLDNSYNYNSVKIKSYSNSVFENFLLSLGPNLIKNEIHCNLLENYSSCFINGIMLLDRSQHHELKTNVNHKYENCKSSQLIKSVLLDKSNGTYQGKIYVDKKAQKTNGYQLSKALILSENSEFNSKPELEIYADDVKCSHGSTTGNIDENSIFYLMSRGLTSDQANKMIVEGFLNEVIETITDPNVKILISSLFNERINKVNV